MKTGNMLIAFFTVVILIAGCTGKKPSPVGSHGNQDIPAKTSPKYHNKTNVAAEDIITQRFQTIADPGLNITTDALPAENIYFQPESVASIIPVYPAEAKPNPGQQDGEPGIMTRPPYPTYKQLLLKTGRTSTEVFFIAVFDNDIFDYTDYYYTNGICLQLFHPAIGSFPLSRALPGLNNSINYYGISLVQNMYTPLKLEDLQPRVGDRPFASYLTVGHQRISLSPLRHQRLQTELVIGVIGPASGGNIAQDLIHTNTPVGWINQVENDFLVNYGLRFDQGIYHSEQIDLALFGGGQAGTLFDNLMGGVYLRVGRTNDLYSSLFQTMAHEKPFRKRIRYYAGLDMKQTLVIYDATLQGGMFNRESAYTLANDHVKRFVSTGTLLLGLGLGRYSLEAEQVYLSPEFAGGRCHFWFRIKNIINLD